MYKIDVTILESKNSYINSISFQYLAAIVPIVGDEIMHDSETYTVIERILFTDNHNFVIIKGIKK